MDARSWALVGGVWAVLVAALGAELWAAYVADYSPPDYLLRRAIERAAEEVVASLPPATTAPAPPRRYALFPWAGDPDGTVAAAVAKRLEASGAGRVLDREWQAELLQEYTEDTGVIVEEAEAAARLARRLGVEVALFGRVADLRDDADVAACALELHAVGTAPDEPPGRAMVAARIPKSPFAAAWQRAALDRTSGGYRVFVWFLWLVGLPFAAYPVERRVFARASNAANAGLLAALIAAAALAAWALAGFRAGWAAAGAAALAAVYDFVILNRLEELE